MKKIDCMRCKVPMDYLMQENIQLGQTGWVLGDLPNLFSGALEVQIFTCPQCGKLEFFQAESIDTAPQVTCPRCGKTHDFDYHKCPFCKYDYTAD